MHVEKIRRGCLAQVLFCPFLTIQQKDTWEVRLLIASKKEITTYVGLLDQYFKDVFDVLETAHQSMNPKEKVRWENFWTDWKQALTGFKKHQNQLEEQKKISYIESQIANHLDYGSPSF